MFKKNNRYKILGFSDKCPKAYMQKLLSMGFIPGTEFYLRQVAPLGNPFQVEVKNTSVSLRKSELNLIKVEAL